MRLFLVAFLSLIAGLSKGQTSTGPSMENIESFSKLAGFLKYYHPCFTLGELDWDDIFIKNYKLVKNINSSDSLNGFLLRWVDTLGKGIDSYPVSKVNKENEAGDYSAVKEELDQITTSPSLKLKISELFLRRKSGPSNRYIHKNKIGFAEFVNERPYDTTLLPDESIRVLALVRFWNIIQYYYPYKELTTTPWSTVLIKLLPDFIHASTPTEYYNCLSLLLTYVNDSHCRLVYKGKARIPKRNAPMKKLPVQFRMVDSEVIVSRFESDLLAPGQFAYGDKVVAIKNIAIDSFLVANKFLISSSNLNSYYRDAVPRLSWSADSCLDLTIERNGLRKDIKGNLYPANSLNRDIEHDSMDFLPHYFLKDDIGYIVPSRVSRASAKSVMHRYRHCKGMIFDLRSYPEFTLYEIMHILGEKRKAFARFDAPDYSLPGAFKFDSYRYCGKQNGFGKKFAGKIAILVDEHTQSRGEFMVMALQTFSQSKVIGSQTAGTDGDVADVVLPGGYHTSLTAFGVSYPDGTTTQRVGIKVDIPVTNSRSNYENRTDALIERAVKYIYNE